MRRELLKTNSPRALAGRTQKRPWRHCASPEEASGLDEFGEVSAESLKIERAHGGEVVVTFPAALDQHLEANVRNADCVRSDVDHLCGFLKIAGSGVAIKLADLDIRRASVRLWTAAEKAAHGF